MRVILNNFAMQTCGVAFGMNNVAGFDTFLAMDSYVEITPGIYFNSGGGGGAGESVDSIIKKLRTELDGHVRRQDTKKIIETAEALKRMYQSIINSIANAEPYEDDEEKIKASSNEEITYRQLLADFLELEIRFLEKIGISAGQYHECGFQWFLLGDRLTAASRINEGVAAYEKALASFVAETALHTAKKDHLSAANSHKKAAETCRIIADNSEPARKIAMLQKSAEHLEASAAPYVELAKQYITEQKLVEAGRALPKATSRLLKAADVWDDAGRPMSAAHAHIAAAAILEKVAIMAENADQTESASRLYGHMILALDSAVERLIRAKKWTGISKCLVQAGDSIPITSGWRSMNGLEIFIKYFDDICSVIAKKRNEAIEYGDIAKMATLAKCIHDLNALRDWVKSLDMKDTSAEMSYSLPKSGWAIELGGRVVALLRDAGGETVATIEHPVNAEAAAQAGFHAVNDYLNEILMRQ